MENWLNNQQTFGFEHMTPPHEEMMTCSPQLWLFSSGDHEMSQVDRISQICVDVPHMQCSFLFGLSGLFFGMPLSKLPAESPRNSLKRDVAEVQEKVSLHSKANDEQRSIQQAGTFFEV